MLAPQWPIVRIGPYLRRERDKRHYNRLFQFDNYVCGAQRWYMLLTSRKVLAKDIDLNSISDLGPRTMVVFKTWSSFRDSKPLYAEILGHSQLLRQALTEMTRSTFRPRRPKQAHIAMHVRLTDFRRARHVDELRGGQTNTRIPIAWYHEIVTSLRRRMGRDVPVRLYSDGNASELEPLLKLPGVEWMVGQAAVTDLLAIADSSLLISSGSGFSFWGSFLGQTPRICFPGQRLIRVLGTSKDEDREPECDTGADIPEGLLAGLDAECA